MDALVQVCSHLLQLAASPEENHRKEAEALHTQVCKLFCTYSNYN